MEGCFYRAVGENLAEEAASEQGREGQRSRAGVEGPAWQADGMTEGKPAGRGKNSEFYSKRQETTGMGDGTQVFQGAPLGAVLRTDGWGQGWGPAT